jgi:hypothetical protein
MRGCGHCVGAAQSLHPLAGADESRQLPSGRAMRAEIEKIVEDIKQSVGLLRRHL